LQPECRRNDCLREGKRCQTVPAIASSRRGRSDAVTNRSKLSDKVPTPVKGWHPYRGVRTRAWLASGIDLPYRPRPGRSGIGGKTRQFGLTFSPDSRGGLATPNFRFRACSKRPRTEPKILAVSSAEKAIHARGETMWGLILGVPVAVCDVLGVLGFMATPGVKPRRMA
jgi:hypothetical protein